MHLADTGDKGSEGSNDGNELGVDDRFPAVLFIKRVCPVEVLAALATPGSVNAPPATNKPPAFAISDLRLWPEATVSARTWSMLSRTSASVRSFWRKGGMLFIL